MEHRPEHKDDKMNGSNDLFSGFAPVTSEQWEAQISKDLKGLTIEDLNHHTADGITIAPFYTTAPTQQPAPLFTHTDWEVCAVVEVYEAVTANSYALDYLNQGATAIIFKLLSAVDFGTLLKDIGIRYIALQFVIFENAATITHALDEYLKEQKIDKALLNITLNYDPIGRLAIYCNDGFGEIEPAKKQFLQLVQENPSYRSCCINGEIYHEAGATPAYEIGCVLAHANEYLGWLQDENPGVRIQLNVATGAEYFMEIAKLRALRKVFAFLLQQYGLRDIIYLHCTTAARRLTIYDHDNNLLRTTTSAMAAVSGGCNSLQVLPNNVTYKQPDDFSERMARNIQLILKGESYFDKVSDVAAGAYYIETLTEALAQKGWNYFKEIEAAGGLIAALEQGSIQQKIAGFDALEQALFDEGKIVLVGTNKYPAENQQMKDLLEIEIIPEPPVKTTILPLIARRIAAKGERARFNGETVNA